MSEKSNSNPTCKYKVIYSTQDVATILQTGFDESENHKRGSYKFERRVG